MILQSETPLPDTLANLLGLGGFGAAGEFVASFLAAFIVGNVMLAMTGVYIRLRTLLTRAQRHNQQQRKELDRLRVQEMKELP